MRFACVCSIAVARGIEPTIYANVLLKRGHAVFDELKQGIKEIEFLTDPSVGEVRIACTEILSYGFLPAVIHQMSRRHPQVAVRVSPLNTESLELPVLQERNVDLVVARIPRSYQNDELDIELLFRRLAHGDRGRAEHMGAQTQGHPAGACE